MRTRWYDLTEEELLEKLQTDAEKGLTQKEAAKRLREDGKNSVSVIRREPKRAYLRQVFSDLTTILMLASALLALLYRRDAGMIVILVVVFLGYALSLFSYVRSQTLLEELGRRAMPTAKVQRRGKLTVIPAEDVVMGDVIYLSHGDVVPCDARLIRSEDLRVLEGGLFPVESASQKDAAFLHAGVLKPSQARNMVYASTVVTGGAGKAIAVETGEDTLVCRMGKNRPIAAFHRLDAVKTVRKITSVTGILLLIPVFVLTVWELLSGGRIIEALLTGLAFASASMCEFYSAFSYAAIAWSMRSAPGRGRKNEKTAFIKNPSAISELKDLDCVMLPLDSFRVMGRARLTEIFQGGETKRIEDIKNSEAYLRILRYGVLSTGLYGGERLTEKNRRNDNVYTPEQEALIAAAEEKGIYNRSLEDLFPILDHRDEGENGSLFETTLVRSRGENVVILRGDARRVLGCCTSYGAGGKVYDMDAEAASELMNEAQTLIKFNRTPIAVATKTNRYSTLTRIGDCQNDLTFEGFLGIEKMLLPGAAMQVEKLRASGVRVLAYTDRENDENIYAAQALGILGDPSEHIRASSLADMTEGVFRLHSANYTFFEGFDVSQLNYTVDVLKADHGYRVGFFAERLEDAYPMYSSRVGFSVEDGSKLTGGSLSGRELHSPLWQKKQSNEKYSCQALNHISDVILPQTTKTGNGGLNSIACAIGCARTIYRNISRLLTCLFFSVGMRCAALLLGRAGTILTPVQMLISGMVFDLFAVFVFVFERYDGTLPKKPRESTGAGGAQRRLLPAALLGAASFLLAFLSSRIYSAAGVLDKNDIPCFCFIELLLLQCACVTLLLRGDKRPLRDLRVTGAYAALIAAYALFFAICFAFPAIGGLFSLSFPGKAAFALAFVLPVLLLIAGTILRTLTYGKRKKEKNRLQKKS